MAIPTKKPRSESGSGAGVLRKRSTRPKLIRSNDDRAHSLRGANDGETWVRARRWVAGRLGEERLAFLAALPLDLTLELGGGLGRIRFCHGAPPATS